MSLEASDLMDLKNKYLVGTFLLGLAGYGGFVGLYEPRADRVGELESRLERLQKVNQTPRIPSEQEEVAGVKSQLELHMRQLRRVEALIPSGEELPELLDRIAIEASLAGVEITLIQPVPGVAEEHYTRRKYEIAVLGSYHQIGAFLTGLAALPRIVTATELNLQPRGEVELTGEIRLEARFLIETYVLPNSQSFNDAPVAG